MFNILLDEFPTSYGGYELNTDFRIGVMISLASMDADLSDYEKTCVTMSLLFKDEYPSDYEEIKDCIQWFLNEWSHDRHKGGGSSVAVMDFDVDQGRIYSAFISQYGIDLNTSKMHFWKFMHLLTNLEECNFTRVIDIRTKRLDSKMSNEERKYYVDAKRTYALKKEDVKSAEDKQAELEVTNTFLSYIGKK